MSGGGASGAAGSFQASGIPASAISKTTKKARVVAGREMGCIVFSRLACAWPLVAPSDSPPFAPSPYALWSAGRGRPRRDHGQLRAPGRRASRDCRAARLRVLRGVLCRAAERPEARRGPLRGGRIGGRHGGLRSTAARCRLRRPPRGPLAGAAAAASAALPPPRILSSAAVGTGRMV